MFSTLNAASLKAASALQAAQSNVRRGRGLETVEWVLVGVALVVVAFVAYQFLGGRMSSWITDLGNQIN